MSRLRLWLAALGAFVAAAAALVFRANRRADQAEERAEGQAEAVLDAELESVDQAHQAEVERIEEDHAENAGKSGAVWLSDWTRGKSGTRTG